MSEPLDRIEAALARLGEEHEPPSGWEARVMAAVAQKPRRPWWMYAAPGLTLAAAAALLVWFVLPPAKPSALALEVRAESATVVRSTQADERAIGDIVHITASGGNRHRVIRVYRDEDHLVLRCPEDPSCRTSGDAITVDIKLTHIGGYEIVAGTASSPLPALPGTLDADIAAITQAGVSDMARHKLNVR